MDNKSEEKWARLEEIGFEHYEISNHMEIHIDNVEFLVLNS